MTQSFNSPFSNMPFMQQTLGPLSQLMFPPVSAFTQSQEQGQSQGQGSLIDDIVIVEQQGIPGPPGPPGNPSPVAVTDVATPTYTALSTDYFLCVLTNGLVTITLPLGILGTVYIVKDCFGDAVTNPITIHGTAGQLIDGSIAIINTNFGSLQFIFNGTTWSIV